MNRRNPQRQPRRHRRSGTVLMTTAIVLPVLLGLAGLVIDAGLLMAAGRQTQSAADAGATAAAMDLLQRRSHGTATTTATTYVREHNRLGDATVTVNIPPSSGPNASDSRYVEVVVTRPVATWLIHVLGVDPEQSVRSRAVAGYKPMTSGAGVLALNPAARPGLNISGGGKLRVNGTVAVNSEGGGLDENGNPINNGNSGHAATVANNSTFRALGIRTVGGVNTPSNFQNFDPNNPNSPLRTRALLEPDPFLHLPPPTTDNGAVATAYPAVSISGSQVVTLKPGVYPSMSITGGTVTFEPGIYVIQGGSLRITSQNVTGDGVMFYMTGSDYNVNTGLPDSGDGANPPPASGNAKFGGVTLNAGAQLSGLNDPASPFHGMLFYQRRLNTEAFSIQGNSAAGNLSGTIYTKWAQMKISGQGTYSAQFIVSHLDVAGTGDVTIHYAGNLVASADQVFLVE